MENISANKFRIFLIFSINITDLISVPPYLQIIYDHQFKFSFRKDVLIEEHNNH